MLKVRKCLALLLCACGSTLAQQANQPAQQSTEASPAPDSAPLAKIGNGVKAPSLISKVEATYSDEAREKHVEGACLTRLIVDSDGKPQRVKIVRCVDASLEQPTLDAVRQYKFKPAADKDGKPVPVMMSVEVQYHLIDGHKPALFCEDGDTGNSPVRTSTLPPPDSSDPQPNGDGVSSLTKQMMAPSPRDFSDQGFCKAARALKDDVGCIGIVDLDAKGKVLKIESMKCSSAEVEEPLTKTLEKSPFQPCYLDGNRIPVRFTLAVKYFVNPPKP